MDINRCDNFTGAIKPIVEGLDPQVDLVVSAHTHQPYICKFNGIPTTSASSFGRLITDIDLTIDHQSKDVTAVDAHNVIVTRDRAEGPGDHRDHRSLRRARGADREPHHRLDHRRHHAHGVASASQESALGDVIADAQLASTSRPTSAAPSSRS